MLFFTKSCDSERAQGRRSRTVLYILCLRRTFYAPAPHRTALVTWRPQSRVAFLICLHLDAACAKWINLIFLDILYRFYLFLNQTIGDYI